MEERLKRQSLLTELTLYQRDAEPNPSVAIGKDR